MDPAAGTTSRPPQQAVPQSRFHLPTLINYIFSSYEIASYLVAKDDLPPSALSPDVLNSCIGVSAILIPDQSVAALLLKRTHGKYISELGDSDDSSPSPNASLSQQIPAEAESLSFVRYAVSENRIFMTTTDRRTPLAFIEKPSPTVLGLRRVIFLKLTELGMPNSFVLSGYYWLENGRSCLTMLCWDLEPKPYTEKHIVLLEQYPSSRFPRYTDVLESLVTCEEFMCIYCTARGETKCGCSAKMVERMQMPTPPVTQRDPSSMFAWIWTRYEPGLKKYSVTLKHHRMNVTVVASTYHEVSTKFGGQEHHINELREHFDRQIINRKNSMMCLKDVSPAVSTAKSQRTQTMHHKSQHWSATIEDIPVDSNAQRVASKRKMSHSPDNSPSSHDVHHDRTEREGEDLAYITAYLEEIESMQWSSGEHKTCKICQSQFARKHDLKRHVRSKHANEREFTCSTCGAGFTRRFHLEVHINRRHEKTTEFRCEMCTQVFYYAVGYRRHMKVMHGVQKTA